MGAAEIMLMFSSMRRLAEQDDERAAAARRQAADRDSDLSTSSLRSGIRDSISTHEMECFRRASALVGGIASDRSSIMAARLGENLSAAATEVSAKLGTDRSYTEKLILRDAVNQLVFTDQKFGSPESYFLAADTLWSRAKAIGERIDGYKERRVREKLESQIDAAIAGGREGIDYSRARFFIRDGSELFTRLSERSWFKNPLILAGAAVARWIGGSPAFSVGDILSPRPA